MSEESSYSAERADMVQTLTWEVRRVTSASVMMSSAIAHRVGMGPNDVRCAEILTRNGPMTAGRLAELSGLTTGAITGVVDRLEKAGWARREPAPDDRRCIIIRPMPRESLAIAGLYDSYVRALEELLAEYDDEQLEMIMGFVGRLATTIDQEAAKMRGGPVVRREEGPEAQG